ncbi:hypothetical protein ACKKBG_A17685 [Auxenochlorella protothecoides x Auxenochlorella symbiontica]
MGRTRRVTVATTADIPQVVERPPPALDSPVEVSRASSFDWKDHWYPIAFTKDIGSAPYPFTLLEEPIVLWRDGAGEYQCLADSCPHRLVPLSEGRVAPDGTLQCAYHGWQFRGDGACTLIPQGGHPASPRACARSYACRAAQGLVWVMLRPAGDARAAAALPPTLPELDEGGWLAFGDMWRDLPYDAVTLIENVIDAGHVPFTHHATVSKRTSSGSFADLAVTERSEAGFRGLWPSGPRRGALGPQATEWRGPNLMRHTIEAQETRGFSNITAVYAVPIAPGRCRAIVRQPFKFKNRVIPAVMGLVPRFATHLDALKILDDDVVFLHLQEEKVVKAGLATKPPGQVYHMPGASDALVTAFRTWIQKMAGGGPFGAQDEGWLARAGPRLGQTQLLDHWESHCSRCESCRTAEQRLKVVRGVAAALGALCGLATLVVGGLACVGAIDGIVSTFSSTSLAAVAGVTGMFCAAMGLLVAWTTNVLGRFHLGRHPLPRNLVPGEWQAAV